MFLRPRKFGKSLFTSILENYYDVNKKEKFDILFEDTYIGKNPTEKKNSYYILRFDFSGIDTSSYESTLISFKEKVIMGINNFNINEQNDFEIVLDKLFVYFDGLKSDKKIVCHNR